MAERVRSFVRWVWGARPDADLWTAFRQTPVIWAITGLVIVVSSLDFALRHSSGFGVLTYYLGDSSANLARGQVWRMLTNTLVNPALWVGYRQASGLEHLANNVIGLMLAGPRMERALGSRRFVVLFVVATLCANAALIVGRPLFWEYGGGTSGAMFGVVGAFVVIAYLRRKESVSERRVFIVSWALVGISALTSIFGNGASNIAHLGGFLSGVALAGVWKAGWLKTVRAGTVTATALSLVALALTGGKCALARRVDPNVVATIPVSRSPVVLAHAFDSLWVNGDGPGPLIRIDPDSNRVVATIRAGTGGGMVPVGGSLWVSGAHSVVEIDPKANRVRSRIDVPGQGPWGLAADGGVLWAALPDKDSVARIDVRTRRVTATKVGRRPFAVVAAAGGVWVSSYDGQKITRLDPRSGRVVRESRFDGRPYWLEFVRGSLWVGEQEGVSRVDPKSLRLIEHVDVGQDVWQMSVDVEGQLWVAERWGFEVSQIDTRRNKVVQRVRVGLRQPLGVAAEEDVWIADSVKQEVLYARL